jgi:hypothetical protein
VIGADIVSTGKWLQIFKIQYRRCASRDTDWQLARRPRLASERFIGSVPACCAAGTALRAFARPTQ